MYLESFALLTLTFDKAVEPTDTPDPGLTLLLFNGREYQTDGTGWVIFDSNTVQIQLATGGGTAEPNASNYTNDPVTLNNSISGTPAAPWSDFPVTPG